MANLEKRYPGEGATGYGLFLLAESYHAGAKILLEHRHKRELRDPGPAILLFSHAIELYLNCFLRLRGLEASEIRSLGHSFEARCQRGLELGLLLKRRTVARLEKLTQDRAYLAARYDVTLHYHERNLARLLEAAADIRENVHQALSQSGISHTLR